MIDRSTSAGRLRGRRGITLIETLVLMTCVGVMLGLCAVTIQLLLRLHTESQARLSAAMVFDRLARQLRTDVHVSESARLKSATTKSADPGASLSLQLKPAHLITYTASDRVIARDEMLLGKRVRHESYSLPRDAAARFELAQEAAISLVKLRLTHELKIGRTDPGKPLEVVATVGKYRARSLNGAEGKKP
jgi:type II secretory pathway pseudopilin PulG